MSVLVGSDYHNSRARSIKTRIETQIRQVHHIVFWRIREQDPLKQGLKRFFNYSISEIIKYSRARSIKTRIETSVQFGRQFYQYLIREQDPLKQGLKHYYSTSLKKN